MGDDNCEVVELNTLRIEDGARELTASPDTQPYMRLAEAVVTGADPAPALEMIRQLPLEERYVWRVASALKWGFADCEDLNVEADKRTLGPKDLAKVIELLRLRPMQFCIFLRALVGVEEMERVMVQAIGASKQQG